MVVTTFDLDEYVHGALKAGARGFLLKDAGPDLLVQAIHAAAGDALIAPSVTARLLAAFSEPPAGTPPAGAPPAQPIEPLTDREVEVLLTVARGRTNAEIADELYISLSTVKTHLASLMTKLGRTEPRRDRYVGLRDGSHEKLIHPRPSTAPHIARALRPGSRLALLVWQALADNDWIRDLSRHPGRRPLPASTTLWRPRPVLLADSNRTCSIVTNAGFADIAADGVCEPMYTGDTSDDAYPTRWPPAQRLSRAT